MKVKEVMSRTPYHYEPETNLGAATELMWKGNCEFHLIVGSDGKVFDVVIDRDICIALGTRNRLPGELKVSEVKTSEKLFYCCPDYDVPVALQAMQTGRVRRLPVIAHDGALAGIVSMDDILLKAPVVLRHAPENNRSFRAMKSSKRIGRSRNHSLWQGTRWPKGAGRFGLVVP